MIIEFLVTFAIAGLIAFSATPIARKLAFKFGAIDIPKDDRRAHKKPIARLGGIAIVVGFIVAIIFYLTTAKTSVIGDKSNLYYLGFFGGILLIVALGIIDDIKHLSAKYKLIIQIVASLLVVLLGDVRVITVTNPFVESGMTDLSLWLSYTVSIIWIIGITNAINLLDGLDGLAAGVVSIASLSLFFISIINNDAYSAIMTAAIAGACLGFLPYNFNPAKIFMGDTGSLFLGFSLAIISIQGTLKSYAAISIIIPLIVLGLPLFDTISTIVRRMIRKKSIMEADRGHIHHRLVDMGLSHRQTVIVLYTASAALGLCGIVLADKGLVSALILVIAVAIFIVGGARYMSEISDDYIYELSHEELKKNENLNEDKNSIDSENNNEDHSENRNRNII